MNRKQRRIAAKLEHASGNPPGATAAVVATAGAAALIEAGLKHQQAGRLAEAEAEACYRRVLAGQSGHADALHLLGGIAHQMRRYDSAVELIGQAVELNGQNPIYFYNLGVALEH
jgi:Flp pilus assembly protein TadD